ncbi:MAG: TetR family transcriptional regulator [bacterium]
MSWQRATKPEQKEQRRAAILEATAELFEQHGIDGASLNAIATQAGISKANVYRYFESREEIFLHLLLQDYQEWVEGLERALAPLAGSNDAEAVAREVTASYLAKPRFPALVAVTTSVLERNITVDAVVWFKTRVLELAVRLGNSIHAALPVLDMERTQQLMMYGHFLVAGLWPAAHPPPAVREALQRPELAYACVDVAQHLEGALLTLIRGLMPTS